MTTERKVEPFAIYTTQGNCLLIALCRLRNGYRAFRLDRIEGLSVQIRPLNLIKSPLQNILRWLRKNVDHPSHMVVKSSVISENLKTNLWRRITKI